MDANKRPGKIRPLVKSGIFYNWEKGPNKWLHTQMFTYIYIHIHMYIPHAIGHSLIQIHSMYRGLTEVNERVWVVALRQVIKKYLERKKLSYSCLLEVLGTLQWTLRKYHVFRKLSGKSLVICISKKFEHLEIWYHVKSCT